MISKEVALGLLFLFQTVFGALGNSFLLGLYIITFLIGPRLRPIDLLLFHLAFVNNLVLLSKGIPQTMAALGFNNFLDGVGCKLVFYCHKVARDLSLCATCLLSSFQVITLSPRTSWWVKLKARAQKSIVPMFLFFWIFHLLTNCIVILYMKGPKGNNSFVEGKDYIYCSTILVSLYIILHTLMFSLPDVLYVGIMIGTSGYLVFVLYRHQQRVQYIHGKSVVGSGSPETRATQTVLLLVFLFVSFYSLNSILTSYFSYGKTSSWLVHISAFLAACFPACSSFILMASDSQVQKYCLAFWEKIMLQF